MQRSCVIVGAGVLGLSTAVHLRERFGDSLDVTLVADKFSPYTTADQAGTIFLPVDWNSADVASTSQMGESGRVQRWAEATFQKYTGFSVLCTAWVHS